jgi:microcystin-dependent protein
MAKLINNVQESLALTQVVPLAGIFPGAGTEYVPLGAIRTFANNYAPAGSAFANGQTRLIGQDDELFSVIGSIYGGDGQSTFALPDLDVRTMIGVGQGPGLDPHLQGAATGTSAFALTRPQLPPSLGGVGQQVDNYQPSLPIKHLIRLEGIFPPRQGDGDAGVAFMGQIVTYAGSGVPDGYAECNGQLLPIAQNTALFSLLGTTYGGNGQTTFALPDLRGRNIVGASADTLLGAQVGDETVSSAELPTAVGGAGQPFDNRAPGLGLNYIIAVEGLFPSREGGGLDGQEKYLSEISVFAGNFAPDGWAFAHGQLLPIAQNTALFSLLGTNYGGNGQTNFALPDLRGRIAVGAGDGVTVGTILGLDALPITPAHLPDAHNDFNADSLGDVLWRHNDGTVVDWLLGPNGAVAATKTVGAPDNTWQLAETGDINRDGRSDILWRHNDGTVVAWFMSAGGEIALTQTLGAPDNGWRIAEAGDINRDGRADIIWRHTDGTVVAWLMNEVSGKVTKTLGAPDNTWHIHASGDFNGDGRDDILWRNNDGTLVQWLMNEVSGFATQGLVNPGSGWQIEGSADFNADGTDDLLWRHDDGTVVAWLLDGLGSFSGVTLGAPNATWHIEDAGDFNRDGRGDILWRNDDGTVAVWRMNASGGFTSSTVGGPEAAWHIQNDPATIV